jgi:hypothetical protein
MHMMNAVAGQVEIGPITHLSGKATNQDLR